MLCDQFKDFQDQHRPSPNHRRVIFFPQDEYRPRFVWLKYEGSPKSMDANFAELEGYVLQPEQIRLFDSHRELRRQYSNRFWIQCHQLAGSMPPNQSLVALLGPYAARWRGPIICMAPLKYRLYTEWDDYDDEDKAEDCQDVDIPYDLDTTSLAVHVACLRFVAKYENYHEYDIQATGVGDGFDPQ